MAKRCVPPVPVAPGARFVHTRPVTIGKRTFTLPEASPYVFAALLGLPLLAAAILAILDGLPPRLLGVLAAVPLASGFGVLLLVPGEVTLALPWAPVLGLELSFTLDGLSRLFSLAISGIGALILLYAGDYLGAHAARGRFLALLLAFSAAMQGLVLAGNTVTLFLFWEMTSVTSFLLIGFERQARDSRRAAIQALAITGAGGLGLLVLAVLAEATTGSWALDTIPATPLLAGLALLAILTKSAQVPFHFWLPLAMEAPTPVSAYLHSATMVQAGVYLALRLSPVFSADPLWQGLLMGLGALTLLWGGFNALRVRDLKQLLAQTTLSALGLSLMMIGTGSEEALAAGLGFFLAHALYKAALFMAAGAIDHATGTRDLEALSGLGRTLPVLFITVCLAAAALLGLPLFFSFVAKETMLAAATGPTLLALILGNALMGGAGLVFAVKPFFGPRFAGPLHPPGLALLGPPLLLAVLGLWFGLAPPDLSPALSAVVGHAATIKPHPFSLTDPAFVMSLAIWGLALGCMILGRMLRARPATLRADLVFDRAYFALLRGAAALSRLVQHGRLERYLLGFIALVALVAAAPLLAHGLPAPALPALTAPEMLVMLLAAVGIMTVLLAQTRLFAILALGVQGLMVALLYLLFGAPDLAFTQAMIEILSVVILTLVMTRLRLDARDPRPYEDFLRDGSVALLAGVAITLLLLHVIAHPLDPLLADFFNAESYPAAHGRNVVNVILVDFRGLDTLGEIAVVLAAGLAVLTLLAPRRVK